MSLVDSGYGSDDSNAELSEVPPETVAPSTSSVVAPFSTIEDSSSEGPRGSGISLSGSSTNLRLPDVSELFASAVSGTTSTSVILQRKRPAVNGSGGHSMPHTKLARSVLQPSRIPPDTAGGLLTPPQLRGRSNVATEDLDKIFIRRQKR